MYIANYLIDFLFPKFCLSCDEVGSYLCEKCYEKNLQKQLIQKCHVCKCETFLNLIHTECREETYLDGVVVGYFYNDLVKRLIFEIKYKFYYAIIDDLVNYFYEQVRDYKINFDVITSVPLAAYKRRKRGFNQAELLGRKLAKKFNKPYEELLSREVNTKTQVGKHRDERLANLHGVFKVRNIDKHVNNTVLLVDDVMTTGSTLEQCAKVLKENGISKVYGMVFARG